MFVYSFDNWVEDNAYFHTKKSVGYRCISGGQIVTSPVFGAQTVYTLPAAIAIGILTHPDSFVINEYSCDVDLMQVRYLKNGNLFLPYQYAYANNIKFSSIYPRNLYWMYLEDMRQEICRIAERSAMEVKYGRSAG